MNTCAEYLMPDRLRPTTDRSVFREEDGTYEEFIYGRLRTGGYAENSYEGVGAVSPPIIWKIQ